jgi:hypothetical protein
MNDYIALSGAARSGKDTVADYLVKNYGYVKVSFASPIREALYRLNPEIDVDGYDMRLATAVKLLGWEQLKTASNGIRGLMQRMGSEVGREMFGPNIWVDIALKEAEKYEKVVFPDCRFPNEALAVSNAGGVVWRVERPGVTAANEHESETALDSYEFSQIIANDGSLEDLWKSIDFQLDK